MDSVKHLVLLVAALAFGFSGRLRAAEDPGALVLTTDFATGKVSQIAPGPGGWTARADLAPICADAAARIHDGLLYIVNRRGCDNIQVLNPSLCWRTVREFSVGTGTNPQDIAFAPSGRAYVSRYDSNWLLVIDPVSGARVDSISLAPLADADGLCEMHRIQIIGSELFVEVQRLDRAHGNVWLPVPPSYLAVIDLSTNRLLDMDPGTDGVQGIVLSGLNPSAPMQLDAANGDLLVPESGAFMAVDAGGIERVDPRTHQSKGFDVTEEELGGDVSGFAQWSDTLGYAVIADRTGNTALVAYNPLTHHLTRTVYNPGGWRFSDCLTTSSGRLLLADSDYQDPGVRIFDAATGAFLSGPIPTGLAPAALLSADGIAAECAASHAWVPFPNPSRTEVRVQWMREPVPAVQDLEVFDLSGRRIRSVPLLSPGVGPVWDLRNQQGNPVGSGVYRIRVKTGDGAGETRPVVVIR